MESREARSSPILAQNARIKADQISIGKNVVIGANTSIEVRHLKLADNVVIGKDVTIKSESLEIGFNSAIEDRCQLSKIRGHTPKLIRLGENSFLGHDTRVHVGVLVIGDYVSIHNHSLLYGIKPLIIGHNCWIGQNCVLNSEGGLTIGNNVGISLYSGVFSHGYFGELLQGCQISDISPVEIEDDVWIAAYVFIGAGITIGSKSFVLPGSTVSKDVAANHTVGGCPARDLTENITVYRELSPREKITLTSQFVDEFISSHNFLNQKSIDNGFIIDATYGRFAVVTIENLKKVGDLPELRPLIVFTLSNKIQDLSEDITIFDLTKRTYRRTRSSAEIEIIKFLKNYRARFVPEDNPRIIILDLNNGSDNIIF